MNATTRFWRAKKLSVRASNCLAKANIADERALVKKFTTFDSLLALRNCGSKTAEEIWAYLTNSKTRVSDCDWETEITSSTSSDDPAVESQSVYIPLLDVNVSAQTGEMLQKMPVNRIQWRVRTQNVIDQQGLRKLADIADATRL